MLYRLKVFSLTVRSRERDKKGFLKRWWLTHEAFHWYSVFKAQDEAVELLGFRRHSHSPLQ